MALGSPRIGVLALPELPFTEMVSACRDIEAMGYERFWLADHFVNPRAPEGPWFETWTLLSALAAVTTRIRLGTLVSSISLRSPAMLARQALTADHISHGRLDLGIGAGGSTYDHRMTGSVVWEAPERTARLQESVAIVDRLLREEVTNYQGRYYQIEGAIMNPRPVQQPRPPLTLAAHGPVTLKLATRYADTWNSYGAGSMARARALTSAEALEATRRRSALLDRYCVELGRDPASIVRSFLVGLTADRPCASVDAFVDFVGRYREAGITEFIVYWLPDALRGRGFDDTMADRALLERIASLFPGQAVPS